MPTTAAPNLLVISDLHLGEDIGAAHSNALDHVEDELVRFLDHHRDNPVDERPWRLVVNGDMVDFLAMKLMPAEAGILTGLDEDDHFYGLGTTAPAALAKMDAVTRRHPQLFAALARFVDAGNELSIVIGNHDVEFYWDTVQQRFVEAMAAHATDPSALRERVHFHPWFFWEDGVWVEHGHLYDPYCSVEDVLDPFTDDGKDLDPSLSGALMRYVNNHYAPHSGHAEPWSFAAYLGWFLRQGGWRMLDIASAFGRMTQRTLRAAGRLAVPSPKRLERRERRFARLRQLAASTRLDPKALLSVDALTRRPVLVARARVLRSLMLDRLALVGASVVVLLLALTVLSWPLVALTTALVLLGLAGAQHYLALHSEAHVSTRRLVRVARAIRERVAARIVVFGHTHEPVARRDAGGWTFNTGSWVCEDPAHRDRAFTHLRIIRGGRRRLHATLRRWTGGRSVPFVPPTGQMS